MSFIPNPLVIPIGMFIGILVAAPVGPVNVLCIQRTLAYGMAAGIIAGIGAVLGDGLIALFAALGVGAITGVVDYHRATIQIIGGLVLLYFGWRLYAHAPPYTRPQNGTTNGGPLRNYAWDIPKTFLLTVTNPGAVLGLFAIFGGASTFVEVRGPGEALLMVGSVMLGSLSWWIGLSYMVGRIRNIFKPEHLTRINRWAGILLMGFGLVLIGEIVFKLITALIR